MENGHVIMDMLLAEIKALRIAITELREEIHHQLQEQNNRLTLLEHAHAEQRGVTRAVRWAGGAVVAALTFLEAWLHR